MEDEWEPLTDYQLNDWISRIRAGERGPEIDPLARKILGDFQRRHFFKVPQSPIAINWIIEALDNIMESGKRFDELALMGRGKGAPKKASRDMHLALWVKGAEQLGYPRAEAIVMAADAFFLEESGVRTIVNRKVEWVTDDAEAISLYLSTRKPLLPPPCRKK